MSAEKNIAGRGGGRGVPTWAWKLSLAACAAIWGGSFVVMKDTLDAIPPAWLMGIRFAALLGEDEIAAGTVALKDLATGQQEALTPEAAASRIQETMAEANQGPIILE